jgi:hypothetical protein
LFDLLTILLVFKAATILQESFGDFLDMNFKNLLILGGAIAGGITSRM